MTRLCAGKMPPDLLAHFGHIFRLHEYWVLDESHERNHERLGVIVVVSFDMSLSQSCLAKCLFLCAINHPGGKLDKNIHTTRKITLCKLFDWDKYSTDQLKCVIRHSKDASNCQCILYEFYSPWLKWDSHIFYFYVECQVMFRWEIKYILNWQTGIILNSLWSCLFMSAVDS